LFDNASVDSPEGHNVPFELLARALGATAEPPTLLVLNGCDTLDGAEVLLEATPVVIAMATEISDLAASAFAARFYHPRGRGYDVVFAQRGRDRVFGGDGHDTLHGGAGPDVLRGQDADYLRGNAGNDKLFGGSGNDVLEGGVGQDEFDGGPGDDVEMQ